MRASEGHFVLAAAVVTVLAAAATTSWQLNEGREQRELQFQEELVVEAFSGPTAEARQEGFDFLVKSKLVHDAKLVSRIRNARPATGFPSIGGEVVVQATTAENAGSTDISLFTCDELDSGGRADAEPVVEALKGTGFGEITLQRWTSLDELPLADLENRLTAVVDLDHPEANEVSRLQAILDPLPGPDLVVVSNRGSPTPWRISVVACSSS